MYLSRQTSS